jgi:hypothetical protein
MRASLPEEAASYSNEIRRFPMLKAEEEYRLAVRWRVRGNESAPADGCLCRMKHLGACCDDGS